MPILLFVYRVRFRVHLMFLDFGVHADTVSSVHSERIGVSVTLALLSPGQPELLLCVLLCVTPGYAADPPPTDAFISHIIEPPETAEACDTFAKKAAAYGSRGTPWGMLQHVCMCSLMWNLLCCGCYNWCSICRKETHHPACII